MSEAHGRFVWYELMSTNPEAAKAFYTAVVGWGIRRWEGPMDYTMWTAGEAPRGGVMQLPEEARAMGAPPHWMGYVDVADVDASTKRAEALGARVLVPPMDIPGVGRFSTFQDPQGAVLSMHQSPQESMLQEPERPGSFSWPELMTSDPEAAWSFYSELFGWVKTSSTDMGPAGIYQEYSTRADGPTLGGIFRRPPSVPVSSWLYYITTADLDQAVATVREKGGQVLNGPMEIPGGGRIAQCMDPQGAAFALYAP
jgi:uncharacterized protein